MPITLDGTNGITTPTYGGADTSEYLVPVTGFKNKIINGAMGIWQRGTSGFTSSGNYSADRWLVSTGTSLSAVGQSSDVPSGFKFSLSTAGTNVPSVRQYIESVNCTDLVGQSVTVSVWIKQTSGAGSNAMYIYLAHANTADTFSGLTQIGSTVNINTTSSWAQYTATFTNLPAGAANGVALIIGSNSSGTSTFLVTGVQLEVGSTATSFDYRPYGTELALCQRYFQVLGSGSGKPLGFVGYFSSTAFQGNVQTKVTMRAAPTFSIVTGTGYYIAYTASNNDSVNSVTLDFASTDAVQFYNNTEASGTANAGGSWATANASAFIALQAEL